MLLVHTVVLTLVWQIQSMVEEVMRNECGLTTEISFNNVDLRMENGVIKCQIDTVFGENEF